MDTDDTVLLRDAMDRTTDGLPPLPDLAPLAVREGRRRRARARIAVATTAFGVVTAGALGLTLLPGTNVPGVSTPADGGSNASYPPVVVPDAPGLPPRDDPAKLSEAERERRARHQQRVAALLDETLPAKITGISPVQDRPAEYRITADGETFRMVVSVRPDANGFPRYCENLPEDRPACEEDTQLRTGGISDMPTIKVTTQYWYRRSWVHIAVYAGKVEVPVRANHLFAVARDPRFLELVKEADARPMEAKEPTLAEALASRGGPAGTASGEGQRAR
ncbi:MULTISPECIES: hypothetical protein [unclassified Streptomyces]|uniref:hypothetical protein n=1 Tax=unclassified Streptomyces TaxID=2593676 RepID=UPI002966EBCC|nr:hypothetical protein [Streptomyces sp. SJL17-1]